MLNEVSGIEVTNARFNHATVDLLDQHQNLFSPSEILDLAIINEAKGLTSLSRPASARCHCEERVARRSNPDRTRARWPEIASFRSQ